MTKQMGMPWSETRIVETQRGELYWLDREPEPVVLISTYSFAQHPKPIFLVLFSSVSGRTSYVYRPREDSQWKEEAWVILDLLRVGGAAVAEEVRWTK